MSELTVSVIIPTYNRANLVTKAIDSLLNQTRPPDEIIVVDDGSTDSTQAVLAEYGHRIVNIKQENQGLSAARNAGLNAATGNLIALLDSDDSLPPESIEIRVTALENYPEYGVVYGNVMRVTPDGKELGLWRQHPCPSGNVFPALAHHNLMPCTSFMFRWGGSK